MDWRSYHRLETIYAFLYGLRESHPDLVAVFPIGKSVEGRDILIAKVGLAKGYQKPAIFLECGITKEY